VLSYPVAMKWPELVITLVAIAGIVYLERLALSADIDGAVLGLAVATVAGLGGYQLKGYRSKNRSK